MTFNLPYVVAALALLWTPLPHALGEDKLGHYHERVESATLIGLIKAWQNWVDLFRAAGGAWLLLTHAFNAPGAQAPPPFLPHLQLAVLLVGVLMQTIRLGSELSFFAPLFYLTGLTPILSGWRDGGFAVAFGWAMAVGTCDYRYLLPALAAMLLGSAVAFGALSSMQLANAAFALISTVSVALLQKRLWFLARVKKRSGRRVLAAAGTGPAATSRGPKALAAAKHSD